MGILEMVAETRLGSSTFAHQKALKLNLKKIESAIMQRSSSQMPKAEKQRVAAILELLFEYGRERDSAERENILRTLKELVENEEIELPKQTIEEWERELTV